MRRRMQKRFQALGTLAREVVLRRPPRPTAPWVLGLVLFMSALPAEARRRRFVYVGGGGHSSALEGAALVCVAIVAGGALIYWLWKHFDTLLAVLNVLVLPLTVAVPLVRDLGWGVGLVATVGVFAAFAVLALVYERWLAPPFRRWLERRKAARPREPVPEPGPPPSPPPPTELERVLAALTDAHRLANKRLEKDELSAYDRVIDGFAASSDERVRIHVADALLDKARLLARLGVVNGALECYDLVVDRYSGDDGEAIRGKVLGAYRSKGILLARNGDKLGAVSSFESGLALAPDDAATLHNLALVKR